MSRTCAANRCAAERVADQDVSAGLSKCEERAIAVSFGQYRAHGYSSPSAGGTTLAVDQTRNASRMVQGSG